MKLRVKPLKGAEFYIDGVTATTTVGEIKKMVQEQEGDKYPAENLKMILLGKILKDDQTLENYDEKVNYIVLIVSKKKKPAAEKPKPKAAEVKKTEVASPATTTTQPTTATTTTSTPAAANQGPVVTDESVQNLIAMGFVESDARAALEAAFGNPTVAVEFLMNPAAMETAVQRNQAAQQPRQTAATGNTDTVTPLTQFRNSPEFEVVRNTLATNPGAMQQVLEGLQDTHPVLFEQISSDTGAMGDFIDLLTGEIELAGSGDTNTGDVNPFATLGGGGTGPPRVPGQGGGMNGMPDMDSMMQLVQLLQTLPENRRTELLQRFGLTQEQIGPLLQGIAGMPNLAGAGGGGGAPAAPRQTITLTEGEQASIARLQELGFSRRACVEAYLACDKDEMLAANFLFNNPPEENEGPPPPPAGGNNNGAGPGDL